jgi:hypothetical protein
MVSHAISGVNTRQAQKFQANQVFSHANSFIYRIGVKQIPNRIPLSTANEIPTVIWASPPI